MTESTSHRAIPTDAAIAFILRLAIGVLFFTAGLNKFMADGGASSVSSGIIKGFQDVWLPQFLVAPYAYVLPYVEFVLGLALILGIFSRYAAMLSALLFLSLAFGKMVTQEWSVVSNNLFYVFLACVTVWFVSVNDKFSVDRLMGRGK